MITFEPFPKIARLSRECIITEKIDGTNAQIIITEHGEIRCGSRTRLLTLEEDNYGFARWMEGNITELMKLGPGRHFGEWWGQKIQRGYGLKEKRFSLFNTTRWQSRHTPVLREGAQWAPSCCYVVPELYRGPFRTGTVEEQIESLRVMGSYAAPGFMQPEGVVVFHTAGNYLFKKTLEKDEAAKGTFPGIHKEAQ